MGRRKADRQAFEEEGEITMSKKYPKTVTRTPIKLIVPPTPGPIPGDKLPQDRTGIPRPADSPFKAALKDMKKRKGEAVRKKWTRARRKKFFATLERKALDSGRPSSAFSRMKGA